MKRKVWLYIGIGVIIFMLGGVLLSDDDDNSTSATTISQTTTETVAQNASIPAETSPAKPVTTVTEQVKEESDDTLPISELVAAYRDNEVAAKKKFQGKSFKFKGKVTDIGEVLGESYVHLDHNISVHFYFRNSDVVANLNKGDKIKLEGRIDSNLGAIITVKNCRLVE